MIKYLKNNNSVVKVNTETKTLMFCIIGNNVYIIRSDIESLSLYNYITITKYQEGKYIDATEQEFLDYKTQCLNNIQ